MWNLGSLTRNWTCDPCIGNTKSYRLDHQGSPQNHFLCLNKMQFPCFIPSFTENTHLIFIAYWNISLFQIALITYILPFLIFLKTWNFPDSPVIKTCASTTGGMGSIPGPMVTELRFHIPQDVQEKSGGGGTKKKKKAWISSKKQKQAIVNCLSYQHSWLANLWTSSVISKNMYLLISKFLPSMSYKTCSQ